MALPTTGPISLGQVNTELKRPATQTISLNDEQVRQLAGRPSGTISMSDLHGKSYTKDVNILLHRSTDISPRRRYYVNYNVVSGKFIVKTTTSREGIWFETDYNSTEILVPSGTNTRESNVPSGTGHWIEIYTYKEQKIAAGEIWFQGTVLA